MRLFEHLSSERTSRGAATIGAFIAGIATVVGLGFKFWPGDSGSKPPLEAIAVVESVRPAVTRGDYLHESQIAENEVDRQYRDQQGLVAVTQVTLRGLSGTEVQVFWTVNASCDGRRLYGSRFVAGRPVAVRPDRDDFTTTVGVWVPAPSPYGRYCVKVSFFTAKAQTIESAKSPFVSGPPRASQAQIPPALEPDGSAPVPSAPAPWTPPFAPGDESLDPPPAALE